MNVLIAVNAKAFTGAEVAIYSFMRYHTNVHWYITTLNIKILDPKTNVTHEHYGLDDYMQDELKKMVKYFDTNSTIEIIDTSKMFMKYLANGPNDFSPFTPYAAIRLMADKIIPEDVHDLLYMDVDTITCQNIEDDYRKYTSIKSPYAAHVIAEACAYEGEMVSAVMFFNMDICRKTKFFETARKNYMTYYYHYPDQMAIRDTADPVRIEESLNYMRELEEAENPLKIIHFSNKLVPKVYSTEWAKFFKIFPQFKDIKEGVELVNSIQNFVVKD